MQHGHKLGVKSKVADIVRSVLALIDADTDGYLTRDEIRVYAVKVRGSVVGRCGILLLNIRPKGRGLDWDAAGARV